MKRWRRMIVTGAVTGGLLLQPVAALAAEAGLVTGTFHIEQFGEYDIHASVETADGRITAVEARGLNFGGTYAAVNQDKFETAADKILPQLKGCSATDATEIMAVDTVSGATVSSNGIKRAVLDALGLKVKSESVGTLDQELEAGQYQVLVSVRSDVVGHSLVEREKAQAELTVATDGKMQLSYRMVSGTEKEPMYILGFHGYYPDNDRKRKLSMEGVTMKTESKDTYTVITDVSFPLADKSGTYYVNTEIYVPAMQNLNGEISGVFFENGKFSVDNIVTVYWESLRAVGETSPSSKEMEISATVEEPVSGPEYTVSIPMTVTLEHVTKYADTLQAYEVLVNTEGKTGTITVAAPEGGELKNGTHRLPFSNTFGTQTVEAASVWPQQEDGTKQQDDSAVRTLSGTIRIAGADVEKVPAGTYSGTTIFTITYNDRQDSDPSGDNGGSTGDNSTGGSTGKPGGNGGLSGGANLNGGNTLTGGSAGSGGSLSGGALSGGSLSGGLGGSLSGVGISLGNPKTGDTSAAAVWITLVASCSVCATAVFMWKKKVARE